jgi:hypothetical protein
MHPEEADSSCRGATAGTSRAAHHHQWQHSPARPSSARVTTTFVAVTRHATSPRAPRDLVAYAVQCFAALDHISGVRPSSARNGAPSPLSSSRPHHQPCTRHGSRSVRAPLPGSRSCRASRTLRMGGCLPAGRRRCAHAEHRRAAADRHPLPARLTPRCSGQHPGIRPGVAAELIRR